MSRLDKYRGIIPAFYACYDEEGNIDPDRIQTLAKHYAKVGVKGLYVGGSSGECIYQTIEERKLVLENVVEAVGDELTIIAHVAAPSTCHSIELAKHAEKVGADALAAIPPIYFVLPEDAIEDYWTQMMEATDLDFIIYNIPQTTGYALSADLYKKMMAKDQVIGVKNSSMPVQDIYEFKQAATKDSVVFNGPDEQYVSGRLMGADSGIGGTYGVMPELFLKADEAVKNSDFELAQKIQYRINDVIFEIVKSDAHLYDIIKSVLALDGIEVGSVRSPLPRVTEKDEERIKRVHQMISEAKAEFL